MAPATMEGPDKISNQGDNPSFLWKTPSYILLVILARDWGYVILYKFIIVWRRYSDSSKF
jgi:hypothetical protein